jgi:hypothetical protein
MGAKARCRPCPACRSIPTALPDRQPLSPGVQVIGPGSCLHFLSWYQLDVGDIPGDDLAPEPGAGISLIDLSPNRILLTKKDYRLIAGRRLELND